MISKKSLMFVGTSTEKVQVDAQIELTGECSMINRILTGAEASQLFYKPATAEGIPR